MEIEMARPLTETRELQNKIAEIQNEIAVYSAAIQEADGEDREILEDHVRQLKTRLEMTETTRKKALRKFYARVTASHGL